MKAPNLHLNLLRDVERRSSSPVRIRVMLPVFALLALAGCLVWWGVVFGQVMMARGKLKSIEVDIAAKQAQHADIIRQMTEMRNLQAELDQLSFYRNARRTYGTALASLAEVVPESVQLVTLEIPEPPKQDLLPPGTKPGMRVPLLLGPTGTVETVAFRLMGRAASENDIAKLVDALARPAFTNTFAALQKATGPGQNPRVLSVRQEMSSNDNVPRFVAFDVEYTCRERRFEK